MVRLFGGDTRIRIYKQLEVRQISQTLWRPAPISLYRAAQSKGPEKNCDAAWLLPNTSLATCFQHAIDGKL